MGDLRSATCSEFFLRGITGINTRRAGNFPAKHRYRLVLASASFRGTNRAGLA
jgi:hypothetical protein